MSAGLCLNQLRRHADALAAPADATLEHISHAKLSGDLAHVDRFALIGERRIAGNDEELVNVRELCDEVLSYAVGKELLLGIATHIGKRQYRDRWLVRHRQGQRWRETRGADRDPIGPHRAGNVLQMVLTHVREGQRELIDNLITDALR